MVRPPTLANISIATVQLTQHCGSYYDCKMHPRTAIRELCKNKGHKSCRVHSVPRTTRQGSRGEGREQTQTWDSAFVGVAGVSNLLASLGHIGRRIVLGHILNTQTLTKTESKKKVLSKFTILCWATVIAILGLMQPTALGLDTPGRGWGAWGFTHLLFTSKFKT